MGGHEAVRRTPRSEMVSRDGSRDSGTRRGEAARSGPPPPHPGQLQGPSECPPARVPANYRGGTRDGIQDKGGSRLTPRSGPADAPQPRGRAACSFSRDLSWADPEPRIEVPVAVDVAPGSVRNASGGWHVPPPGHVCAPSGLRTAAVVRAVLAAGLLLATSLRGHRTSWINSFRTLSTGLSDPAANEPLTHRHVGKHPIVIRTGGVRHGARQPVHCPSGPPRPVRPTLRPPWTAVDPL